MEYTAVLAYDARERVYNVSVPALPGCFTWGRTKQQALIRAQEAVEGYLEVLKEAGEPLPKEVGLHRVRVG